MRRALAIPALRFGAMAVLAWLICCAVMLWLHRHQFTTLDFFDPDDALRLQQVRDWIGGQSFWDVSQHRVSPPAGGPMHWSRIVDMPIAALILLAAPLIGMVHAEMFACSIVPLLLLGGTCWALYRAAERLGGSGIALASVVLLATTPTILMQFAPFRIDHHGWQIAMAAVALAGAFARDARRGGVTCGLALAMWLQISSEGLPYAALFAGMLSLRFLVDGQHRARLIAFAATLGVSALVLLVLTRGWSAPFQSHCDSFSAPYAWPLAAYSLVTLVAAACVASTTASRRLVILMLGAGAAVVLFALVGGQCVSGDPFQALGPFAYKHWYLHVMEGQPIWAQAASSRGLILLPPLLGLTGCMLAARHARGQAARADWLCLALLLLGAVAVAVMVMRAMSVAHLIALPGCASLILTLLRRFQASPRATVRVLGSSALMLLTPVGTCALWAAITSPAEAKGAGKETACGTVSALAPLNRLKPATLLAPLDIGPAILIDTPHSVIATAHHRNAAGIAAVMRAYMAPPPEARAIIAGLRGGRGADYVLACSTLNEFSYDAKTSPKGLAAQLLRGRHPGWLQPVPSTGPLKIYRIAAPSGTKPSATPFMQ